jgi:hypothetical protein
MYKCCGAANQVKFLQRSDDSLAELKIGYLSESARFSTYWRKPL